MQTNNRYCISLCRPYILSCFEYLYLLAIFVTILTQKEFCSNFVQESSRDSPSFLSSEPSQFEFKLRGNPWYGESDASTMCRHLVKASFYNFEHFNIALFCILLNWSTIEQLCVTSGKSSIIHFWKCWWPTCVVV